MDRDELIRRLRAATEYDVDRARADTYADLVGTASVDLLEYFNRMVDVLIGEDQG